MVFKKWMFHFHPLPLVKRSTLKKPQRRLCFSQKSQSSPKVSGLTVIEVRIAGKITWPDRRRVGSKKDP